MGDASRMLMELRPVTFRYKAEVSRVEGREEYGLIAEEVAEVAPALVVRDEEGEPHSVRYHVLPSLLLNEIQKQHSELAKQQRTIEGQQRRFEDQQRTGESQAGVIEEQRQAIASLTSRLEMLERELAGTSPR